MSPTAAAGRDRSTIHVCSDVSQPQSCSETSRNKRCKERLDNRQDVNKASSATNRFTQNHHTILQIFYHPNNAIIMDLSVVQ